MCFRIAEVPNLMGALWRTRLLLSHTKKKEGKFFNLKIQQKTKSMNEGEISKIQKEINELLEEEASLIEKRERDNNDRYRLQAIEAKKRRLLKDLKVSRWLYS